MRFFNFFLNHMVKKYQNEIAPIFYYGKSPKTNEKDLKIPNLQPPDWGRLFWMTLYFIFINFSLSTFILFLDVSPPSIVECMYVGNYYLSLTSASDQRQCKLAQGTRSRSERVVHGRRCRLCILSSSSDNLQRLRTATPRVSVARLRCQASKIDRQQWDW